MRLFITGLSVILLSLVFTTSLPQTTFAADKGKKKQEKPLPAIHDDATFAANTKTFRDIPFGQGNLEYKITLPKNWDVRGSYTGTVPDFSKRILNEIGYFMSPQYEALRASVSIEAVEIEHEIAAADWLRNFITSNGYAPMGETKAIDLLRATGAYIYVSEGQNVLTRLLVQVSGKLAIVVRFEIPLHEKEELAYLQQKVLESFNLLYKVNRTIEQRKTFSLIEVAKFDVPVSWSTPGSDFRNLNRPSVTFYNKNQNLVEGLIRISAAKRTSDIPLTTEIENFKRFFTEQMNIRFSELISNEEYGKGDLFPAGRIETYRVSYTKDNRHDQEARFILLANEDWYLFILMITPDKDNNFYAWARDNRTLDILLDTLR